MLRKRKTLTNQSWTSLAGIKEGEVETTRIANSSTEHCLSCLSIQVKATSGIFLRIFLRRKTCCFSRNVFSLNNAVFLMKTMCCKVETCVWVSLRRRSKRRDSSSREKRLRIQNEKSRQMSRSCDKKISMTSSQVSFSFFNTELPKENSHSKWNEVIGKDLRNESTTK